MINQETIELAREIKNHEGNEELTWADCVGEASKTLLREDLIEEEEEEEEQEEIEIKKKNGIAEVKLSESPENKTKAIELVGKGWNFVRYNRFHKIYIFEEEGSVSFVDTTRTPRPKAEYKEEENLCAFEQGGVLDYLPGRCKEEEEKKEIFLNTTVHPEWKRSWVTNSGSLGEFKDKCVWDNKKRKYEVPQEELSNLKTLFEVSENFEYLEFSLKIDQGVIENPPLADERKSKTKHWAAIVEKDLHSPGGLKRHFLDKPRSSNFLYCVEREDKERQIKEGDVLEFAADRNGKLRLYCQVLKIGEKEIRVLKIEKEILP